MAYQNESARVTINCKIKNATTLEGWSRPRNHMTFGDFLNHYINCLDSIENWINKHSNFRADLNL
jgi:hypothetical protein